MRKQKVRHNGAVLGVILLCISTLLVTSWLAFERVFFAWEEELIYAVYELPVWLGWVFFAITQFGSMYFVIILGLALLLARKRKLALEILGSGLVAYIIAALAKILVNRPRPSNILEGILQRYDPAVGLGFPSGHAAVAAAIATTLWFVAPRKHRPLLIIGVILVGLSRLYLGLHAPLDILGGASIGVLAGLTVRHFFKQYLYKAHGKLLTSYASLKMHRK